MAVVLNVANGKLQPYQAEIDLLLPTGETLTVLGERVPLRIRRAMVAKHTKRGDLDSYGLAFAATQVGIKGWKNVQAPDGSAIPYSFDLLIDVLNEDTLIELSGRLEALYQTVDAEMGNSNGT